MTKTLVKQETVIPEWLRGVLAETIPAGETGRHGECILVPAAVVSYRLCTKGYQCHRCEFYQAVQEAGITG